MEVTLLLMVNSDVDAKMWKLFIANSVNFFEKLQCSVRIWWFL